MNRFSMNRYLWQIQFVDPNSPLLVDRTNRKCLATTDTKTFHVYLSRDLSGDMLNRVLIHELGHCALFSFGLLDEIHQMVKPEYWIDMEEFICNFIADYGYKIFSQTSQILGSEAWIFVPYEMEKLVA